MNSSLAQVIGIPPKPHPLRDAFLGWQCRVRQHAMREKMGRPDDEIMPYLTLNGQSAPLGQVITVFNKLPSYSLTPEFRHMAKRTHDPAQRRDKALQFFSSTYYQKPHEFSDTLTACFQPDSAGAARIYDAKTVALDFSAFTQKFTLQCAVLRLLPNNPFYQATWWHNYLFNRDLSGDVVILGFEPDWDHCFADPPMGARADG